MIATRYRQKVTNVLSACQHIVRLESLDMCSRWIAQLLLILFFFREITYTRLLQLYCTQNLSIDTSTSRHTTSRHASPPAQAMKRAE